MAVKKWMENAPEASKEEYEAKYSDTKIMCENILSKALQGTNASEYL